MSSSVQALRGRVADLETQSNALRDENVTLHAVKKDHDCIRDLVRQHWGRQVWARGGYNSDDITKVGMGGGGGLLSQEAVMTE